MKTSSAASMTCIVALAACSPGADDSDTDAVAVPSTYTFNGALASGDSVAYNGQVFRHVLIRDLSTRITGLTARIDAGWFPGAGDVSDDLDFYLAFDGSTSSSVEHGLATEPAPVQATYGEIASGKDLWGKVAGNDPIGQHEDWNIAFHGWGSEGSTSPESLLRSWIAALDAAAVARSNGIIPDDPLGAPITAVHITADGRDLAQLTQKFLLASIAFSQGADDYLDDDLDGEGLRADHSALVDGESYTALEHAWDEGFGYFGAARDYGNWTDAEIADAGYRDTYTPDGRIDLLTEVSYGHALNAGKRDLGATTEVDFSGDAWAAFLAGRHLIASSEGPLSDADFAALQGWRDEAVSAWEKAIAATCVHYANEVIVDMDRFGTAQYNFADHAKHWSELKGFALSFQFNPRSPMDDATFAALHDRLGTAPVLANAEASAIAAYRSGLLEVRDMFGATYDFDPANLGDEHGQSGW